MTNNHGNKSNVQASSSYDDGEPVTNANDEELQQELEGNAQSDEAGDRALDIDSNKWGGMKSGAIVPGHQSTQSQNWLENIPTPYKEVAKEWAAQRGVIKITPLEQRQKFTYSTIAYIADKQEEPKTQIFPISDLQVNPHQINWDFYSSTEGRIGVSNAVEEHMSCEFDVYLTDLIAMYWTFGEDNKYDYGFPTRENLKRRWWNAIADNTYRDFEGDIESTKEFIDFRNTFLQQHMGWVCRFASHTFGVFQGVINQVNYNIGNGESFAKWHIKIEEAVFLKDAYSTEGKKPEATTSDGSTTDSGAATDAEDIDTSTGG